MNLLAASTLQPKLVCKQRQQSKLYNQHLLEVQVSQSEEVLYAMNSHPGHSVTLEGYEIRANNMYLMKSCGGDIVVRALAAPSCQSASPCRKKGIYVYNMRYMYMHVHM